MNMSIDNNALLFDEPDEPPGLALLASLPGGDARHRRKAQAPSDATSPRFYQDLCPPFPHEPTRDRFRVIHSGSVGEGLIALVDFAPGDVVFSFTGPILSEQTLFTLQVSPGQYLEDPLVMGKVLHSCDPNMVCSMEHLTFWAVKPIKAGDYLFMDYESTEDQLFRSFHCCCGAPQCRGEIRGRQYVAPQDLHLIKTLKDLAHVVPL